LDSFKVGTYNKKNPGQALIRINSPYFTLPQGVYQDVLRALRAFNHNQIPCDSSHNITYTVGGLDLVLGPDDYVDRSRQNGTGNCFFRGSEQFGTDNFQVPTTVLRNKCLLFNYETKEIGLTRKMKR